MISSRWPRPIGIIESIAFRPVCIGSLTGWRWTTPGALNSAGRVSVGLDVALAVERVAERVDDAAEQALADRDLEQAVGALDRVALDDRAPTAPNSTAPTLSDSRFSARPVTSCGSSSISNDLQFSRPWTRAMPSATERTVPTSVRSAWPSSSPSMRLLRMEVISSGLICMSYGSLGRLARLACEVVRGGCGWTRRGSELPTRTTMPPRMSGSTLGGQLDLAAGLLADAVADLLDGALVELDRRGDLRPGAACSRCSHSPSSSRRMRKMRRHAVLLDQQLEEVAERSASAPVTALSRPSFFSCVEK